MRTRGLVIWIVKQGLEMIDKQILIISATALILAGCVASTNKNIELVQGPPVESISTPYNELVHCIADQNIMTGTWAVAASMRLCPPTGTKLPPTIAISDTP